MSWVLIVFTYHAVASTPFFSEEHCLVARDWVRSQGKYHAAVRAECFKVR